MLVLPFLREDLLAVHLRPTRGGRRKGERGRRVSGGGVTEGGEVLRVRTL